MIHRSFRELLGRWRALFVIAIVSIGGPAIAHQTSIKYVDVTVDGGHAAVKLTVAPGDVTEPLGLPADARPSVVQAATPAVASYVARWLTIGRVDDAPCGARSPHAHADLDQKFVVVEWEVVCSAELDHVELDFREFFKLDQRHEAIVTVHAPGMEGDATVVRATDPVLRVHAGEKLGLGAWIVAGIEHIWEGRDHVCFVLALLLVVMLVRMPSGEHDWATRGPLATLRHTATIITAFTIAHSISLIAASLGWVSLPSRVVESLIAVSIVYTAVENIVKPDVRWRFVLTFGFGLVHGLGFASVLQVMLPPDHVIGPLLGFNLGVEIGQLLIVVIALPILWLLAHELGAARYRHKLLPIASIAIAAIGIKWLIERVLGIVLFSIWGM